MLNIPPAPEGVPISDWGNEFKQTLFTKPVKLTIGKGFTVTVIVCGAPVQAPVIAVGVTV